MITKIDHIGIAVETLERALPFWADALGLTLGGVETVESENVAVALLPVGSSRIELLEPTAADSAVARFVAKHGAGIHHLTLEVRDLPGLLAQLQAKGVEILGGGPRTGAGGRAVAFIHPRCAGGVLLELAAAPAAASEPASFAPDSPVLLYLRDPQEKLWGVLRRLDAAGVVVEGIDLGSFEDWVGQIERGEESVAGPSVLFLPMLRVEKVLLDRSSGGLPSLAERFERRVGRSVQTVLEEFAPPSG